LLRFGVLGATRYGYSWPAKEFANFGKFDTQHFELVGVMHVAEFLAISQAGLSFFLAKIWLFRPPDCDLPYFAAENLMRPHPFSAIALAGPRTQHREIFFLSIQPKSLYFAGTSGM
jgi:hypothetical protein